MTNLIVAVVVSESIVAPLLVAGVVALVRGISTMRRLVDRLVEIVAPTDQPAARLDRRVDQLERFRDEHVAWHRGQHPAASGSG